jgi:PAS domain S-box-containing protein
MTRAAQLLEERSRLLLDLTHDAVLVCDMDGRISYWNRGAEDLFGWTADEALGQLAHELLQTVWPEPFADIAARLLARADGRASSSTPARRDAHHRRNSVGAATRHVGQSRRPYRYGQRGHGPKAGAEALRKSEEQWRAVFEHNPTMYFMIDPAAPCCR